LRHYATACRQLVEEVRSHERDIMEFAVNKSGMPRAHFIKVFPGNESNLGWVTKEINSKKAYAEELTRHQHTIVERQQRLIALQEKAGHPDQGPEGNQSSDVHRRSTCTPRQT